MEGEEGWKRFTRSETHPLRFHRVLPDAEPARRSPRPVDVECVRTSTGARVRQDPGRGRSRGNIQLTRSAPHFRMQSPAEGDSDGAADSEDSGKSGGTLRARSVYTENDLADRFV